MLTEKDIIKPDVYNKIVEASANLQFTMPSDLKTGSLLKTLAASKPSGRFLDIGTGTGLSLAWLASGADMTSSVISIDIDAHFQQIAIDFFKDDHRITILTADANNWLTSYAGPLFDLIFADAMPGKYESLEETLALVNIGGYYVIDDLLPQPNWPEGHQERVDALMHVLKQKDEFVFTPLDWSTGLIVCTRIR